MMLRTRHYMAAGLMLAAAGFMISCDDDDDDNDPNNPSPTVSVTAPANGLTVATGADIMLKANASDDNGTIKRVEFYEGANKLGEDSDAPYEFEWKDVEAGNYSITVIAIDNDGAKTTSPVISITVQDDELIGKNWKLTAKTVSPARAPQIGADPITDWYTQLENCEKDNLKKYMADNTVTFDEGASKCDSNDAQTEKGSWLYNSNNTIITETRDDAVIDYKIVSVSDTQLKVTYTETDLVGTTYTYTNTYTAQ